MFNSHRKLERDIADLNSQIGVGEHWDGSEHPVIFYRRNVAKRFPIGTAKSDVLQQMQATASNPNVVHRSVSEDSDLYSVSFAQMLIWPTQIDFYFTFDSNHNLNHIVVDN